MLIRCGEESISQFGAEKRARKKASLSTTHLTLSSPNINIHIFFTILLVFSYSYFLFLTSSENLIKS